MLQPGFLVWPWRSLKSQRFPDGASGKESTCQCRGHKSMPSSKGLPSKRCPGVRFLSRVDREFGIFQHVDEGTTRRDTDIPMHRLEKPADSTHSSKCGLSPREQLERQVKLHSFTQDEALPSWPNSSGTLRSESNAVLKAGPLLSLKGRESVLLNC